MQFDTSFGISHLLAVRAARESCVKNATIPRRHTRRKWCDTRGPINLAPVDEVVVLFAARIGTVYPAPATQAAFRGTRGQVARDLEVDILEPRAGVVDADDRKLQSAFVFT